MLTGNTNYLRQPFCELTSSISVYHFQEKASLTEETIKGAMESIASLHLFEKDGIKRYSGVRGARYVTREVEEIFTNEEL